MTESDDEPDQDPEQQEHEDAAPGHACGLVDGALAMNTISPRSRPYRSTSSGLELFERNAGRGDALPHVGAILPDVLGISEVEEPLIGAPAPARSSLS